jgi:hypothetical protein
VTALRSSYRIPVYCEAADGVELWLNLGEAAAIVGVAPRTLRLAAARGEIDATHPQEDGPWIFSRADLDGTAAADLALRAKTHPRHLALPDAAQRSLFSSTT